MTPERQKWWSSLPKEEKRVRRSIKLHKEFIKDDKEILNTKIFCNAKDCKSRIREAKKVIKTQRKELAQRPVIRTQPPTASPYKCPRCGASLMYLLRCVECGQKLRWA